MGWRQRISVLLILTASASSAQESNHRPLVRVDPVYRDVFNSCSECEDQVLVEFTITETGTVADPRIVESDCDSAFDELALQSLRTWKYEPHADTSSSAGQPKTRSTISCEKPNCTCTRAVQPCPTGGYLGVIVLPYAGAPPGVLLAAVHENPPAHKAGLQAFDIIVQYNSRTLHDAAELSDAVVQARPGEGFEAIVLRSGKYLTLSGVVGERPRLEGCVQAEAR